jgi:hypothetical protein
VRKRALSTINPDRASTSLAWLVDFLDDSGRLPFKRLRSSSDLEHSAYNTETLEMLGEYIRGKGSRQHNKLGQEIASDTIDGYISTIKSICAIEARCAIVLEENKPVLAAASKATRRAQPAKAERQLKRGIRAQHLRRLAGNGWDRSSPRGIIEWAAALVSWNILLRGGEIGVVPGKAFDPSRGSSFGSIDFHRPDADSRGLPYLVWYVVPIKDGQARRQASPMTIRRRQHGPIGADPLCVYDAIAIAWQAVLGSPPPTEGRVQGPAAQIPFFRCLWKHGGPVWDTEDTRDLARRMAISLGLDPNEFGGKSFRIGGATDWRQKLGADSERLIRQRGRWLSDIALCYQRALARQHLDASAAVADAEGADLEALCPGWAQPTG